MKKVYLLLCLLLAYNALSFGNTISADKAKVVGYNYLHQHGVTALTSADDLRLVYTSGTAPAYFYVFSGDHSFVIVSADDAVRPIAGYGTDQPFEEGSIAPHVAAFFETYNRQIDHAIAAGTAATPAVAAEWHNLASNIATYSTKRTTTVSPMLTTTWNQNPTYNALCPADGLACSGCGGRAPTGCVATAMAQVMKFWNWPGHGTGSNTYTHPTYGSLTADFASTTYNWAAMPLSSANTEVSTLMYQAGVSVNMNYGPTGSSASAVGSAPSAEQALKDNFCYRSTLSGVRWIRKSNFTDATWLSAIEDELDLQHPIIYCGDGSLGGHAWVVDGYDGSDYFHCNWGWGGLDNGYYYMSNMEPGPTANGDYNHDPYAVIGIVPNLPSLPSLGAAQVCIGYQKSYGGGTSGGTWTSGNMAIATVNSAGIVTGIATGTALISYTVSNSCGSLTTTAIMTVMDPTAKIINTKVGLSAALINPYDVATDGAGNIYIADAGGSVVKKVSPTGVTTIIAGNGLSGFSGDGGSAILAKLYNPQGVCVDGSGNIFIADAGNNRIRKVDAAGTITTVAGSSSTGFAGDGGAAVSAQLALPNHVAVNSTGDLYIADGGNYRIRKVTAAGTISTIAGSASSGFSGDGGPAVSARLSGNIGGIAVDAGGNVVFADGSNNRIRQVSASGTINTIAGGGLAGLGDGGAATAATISYPRDVAVDGSGNIFIADANDRVRMVKATTGIITTIAGNGTTGYYGDGAAATAAAFAIPFGVAVTSAGDVLVLDNANKVVRIVNSSSLNCPAISGINDAPAEAGNDFKVFPNPNNGSFTVQIPEIDYTATITVMDLMGRVVETRQVHNSTEQQVTIALQNVPMGSYLVRVATGEKIYREKIIVQ